MKCLKCENKAVFEIRRHRAAFCKEHYILHIQNQVAKAIKKFRMFPPKTKLLIAISGGKDSLALWDILLDLGYNVHGLYIDLGIDEYSKRSKEKSIDFKESRQATLHTISLEKIYGIGIGNISKKTSRKFCSICGIIKRYIMNKTALLGDYYAVITGHNLDDEAAALFGNLMGWQVDYLRRQHPNMPPKKGFARKVKPLCRLGEREMAAYCVLKNIDYIIEECPMSKGASSITYKEALNTLEAKSPGIKDHFYLGFLRGGQEYFKDTKDEKEDEEAELNPCEFCHQPTYAAGKCNFCKQMEKANIDPLKIHDEIKSKVTT
ncbi:adenine nucleotide alpha hydrolase family protein [Natranaerofaba carboxydovora]|uniref:adenine nucleotide alpha hydrolase family protein n=1 Tax=Natranaerofaba carboxydovora TaxID=2742683 RepID=UPI001F12D949|nr:adenine nucleotide alpha hydrolase family protein [Natranaerofaba carboxydovora]UMZ73998.1 tRNA 2-thiocytidine biosynthesis protein TtcA [Natranaerofaba carboxydovora]